MNVAKIPDFLVEKFAYTIKAGSCLLLQVSHFGFQGTKDVFV